MDSSLNGYIDHTLLKPDATQEEIERLCREAVEYGFASVCVNPTWVACTRQLLQGTSVKLCSVVGFPLGANTSEIKAQEAVQLAALGAHEIDMVLNVGALKSKHYDSVRRDIEGVVRSASGALVKVILETCLLTEEEKRIACLLSVEAGASFVKTSTGFSEAGATVADILLMRKTVGPDFGIKASGGIRDVATALEMIHAGATRLGTSSGVLMMQCLKSSEQ